VANSADQNFGVGLLHGKMEEGSIRAEVV